MIKELKKKSKRKKVNFGKVLREAVKHAIIFNGFKFFVMETCGDMHEAAESRNFWVFFEVGLSIIYVKGCNTEKASSVINAPFEVLYFPIK